MILEKTAGLYRIYTSKGATAAGALATLVNVSSNETVARSNVDKNGNVELAGLSLGAGTYLLKFFGANLIRELPAAINRYKGSWEQFTLSAAGEEIPADHYPAGAGTVDTPISFPARATKDYFINAWQYGSDGEGGFRRIIVDPLIPPFEDTRDFDTVTIRSYQEGEVYWHLIPKSS